MQNREIFHPHIFYFCLLGASSPLVVRFKITIQTTKKSYNSWGDLPPDLLPETPGSSSITPETYHLVSPPWQLTSVHIQLHIFFNASDFDFGRQLYQTSPSSIPEKIRATWSIEKCYLCQAKVNSEIGIGCSTHERKVRSS